MSAGLGNVAALWFGEASIEGTIHCFVERRPLGVLTGGFYGSRAITLASTGDFDGQAVPLTEVGLATAIANVSAPAAFPEVTVRVHSMLENGNRTSPPPQVGAPGEHSIPMVLLSGTRTVVTAKGETDLGSSESGVIAPAAVTIEADLALLVLPSVTSPAADATVPSTDPIAWTGSGHAFLLGVRVPTGLIEVVTTEESAELPDLAPFGLAAPAGAATIGVYEYGPVTSVDELVDGTAFFELIEQRRDFQIAFGYVYATLN